MIDNKSKIQNLATSWSIACPRVDELAHDSFLFAIVMTVAISRGPSQAMQNGRVVEDHYWFGSKSHSRDIPTSVYTVKRRCGSKT